MNKLLKKIINGEFINVIYNDDIYLLVDEFVCDKKHIVFFNSLNKELFCYKKGNDYEIIDEEKLIEKVKDENGLYKDEYLYFSKFNDVVAPYVEITGGERKLIIEKALDKITTMCTNTPREELSKKLLNLRIKKVGKLKDIGLKGASSAYHIKSNTIYVRSDEYKDSVFFHEIVHALSGKDKEYNDLLGIGLIEGITESKTIEAYNKNISSNKNGYEYNFDSLNGSNYTELASISNQLEFILGDNLLESIINNDSKFIEKFYKKYGMNTYLSLRYKLNKICKMCRNKQDVSKELDEVQDLLLRSVFDKEFESVVDKESAIKYFDSLNSFGLFRARKDKEDTLLKKYFNEKKNVCFDKLKIDFNYEPVKFKNKYLFNEYERRILNDLKSYISLNYKDGDVVKVYKHYKDNKCYGVFYINDKLLFTKEYDLNGSRKVNMDFDMSELEEIKISNEQEKVL